MLDAFGLINMNGRMYDPVIGRILSPDIFVQSPTNTQSYNRYTYCFNNPLKYTDPSGWIAPESDGPEVVWNAPGFGPGTRGGVGPGSGNHWSDADRGETGNFFLMSSSTFDNKYGEGAAAIAQQLMSDPTAFRAWQQGLISTNSVRQVGYMGPSAGLAGEPGKSVVENQYGTWVYTKESVWVQTVNKLNSGTVAPGNGYSVGGKMSQKQTSGNDDILKTINAIAGWAGVSADVIREFLATTVPGSNLAFKISYTNILVKGVNSLQPIAIFTIGINTGSDLILSFIGKQSWGETGLNIAASYTAYKIAAQIGGWYGIAFQLNYMAGKEYIKMLNTHPEYAPYPYHGFNK
jgi:RHS repeat-associated protein